MRGDTTKKARASEADAGMADTNVPPPPGEMPVLLNAGGSTCRDRAAPILHAFPSPGNVSGHIYLNKNIYYYLG